MEVIAGATLMALEILIFMVVRALHDAKDEPDQWR